jgi:hypothetical protein
MGIQYVNKRWVVTMAIPHDHENDIPSYQMTVPILSTFTEVVAEVGFPGLGYLHCQNVPHVAECHPNGMWPVGDG